MKFKKTLRKIEAKVESFMNSDDMEDYIYFMNGTRFRLMNYIDGLVVEYRDQKDDVVLKVGFPPDVTVDDIVSFIERNHWGN